jgi:hypothetical protein
LVLPSIDGDSDVDLHSIAAASAASTDASSFTRTTARNADCFAACPGEFQGERSEACLTARIAIRCDDPPAATRCWSDSGNDCGDDRHHE